VQFASLSDADIAAYAASGEGLDKAGSYGVQGLGGQLVEALDGCYFNVMGLPLHRLSSHLAQLLQLAEDDGSG
jgi:septum formation protein